MCSGCHRLCVPFLLFHKPDPGWPHWRGNEKFDCLIERKDVHKPKPTQLH